MLKLRSRRAVSLKCPRHPRAKYDAGGPASCTACQAIATVSVASIELDRAERRAYEWIARTSEVKV